MKFTMFLLLFVPCSVFSQKKQAFNEGWEFLNSIPIENGQVIYEKVFLLDSVNDKDKVFNSAKAALIKNTNYKYSKIDEDRTAGNISSEINFKFTAKAGIIALSFFAKGLLSIDVKENRFRVRIINNTASTTVMNVPVEVQMTDSYKAELDMVEKKKWKAAKSMVLPWDAQIRVILEAFGILIAQNVSDDF
jgi:hypothetical protein